MNALTDGARDGHWQHEAARAVDRVLATTEFVGAILIVISPNGRVVPVAAMLDEVDADDIAEILRGVLENVEAGRISSRPKT
jgi:hypothetical protein